MNLIEIYVRSKNPDIIRQKELDEFSRKTLMKAMLMAQGMMVFYTAMATYNMYFVLMQHKYGYLLNLIVNIVLFFCMRWCVITLRKSRNKLNKRGE